MVDDKTPHSRLFYHGTSIEVMLGDRVLVKRFLRKPIEATVSYIPGISPRNPQLEYEDVKQWDIRLADGSGLVMGYFPEHVQPAQNIMFVSRGAGGEVTPAEDLGL